VFPSSHGSHGKYAKYFYKHIYTLRKEYMRNARIGLLIFLGTVGTRRKNLDFKPFFFDFCGNICGNILGTVGTRRKMWKEKNF
jgi:hypothetical protein